MTIKYTHHGNTVPMRSPFWAQTIHFYRDFHVRFLLPFTDFAFCANVHQTSLPAFFQLSFGLVVYLFLTAL
jgi:hypothetical protein